MLIADVTSIENKICKFCSDFSEIFFKKVTINCYYYHRVHTCYYL